MHSPCGDVENYHIPIFNKSTVYHLTNVGVTFGPCLAIFLSASVLISEQAAHSSEVFQSIQHPRLFYFPDLSDPILPNFFFLA
jgi:hypothetical protein